MTASFQALDKASYRNRGGLLQRLISKYKSLRWLDACGQDELIKSSVEFRISEGGYIRIGNGVTLQDHVFFQLTLPNPKVYIGNNSFIGRNSISTAKNLIRIGNDVLIGSNVQIIDHGHGMVRSVPIREQRAVIGEVIIGDDVWIGAGAKLLMNVNVGTGAVIGANAVVVTDIPDYAVAVGVPARVIKYRE